VKFLHFKEARNSPDTRYILSRALRKSERGWSNAARMRQCEAGCFMRETNRFFGPAHASSHGRERIGPPPPPCPSVHNLVARVSYSVSSSLLLSSLLSLPLPSLYHTHSSLSMVSPIRSSFWASNLSLLLQSVFDLVCNVRNWQ
jgi:hypothetical protein